jgi:hypothetical protein
VRDSAPAEAPPDADGTPRARPLIKLEILNIKGRSTTNKIQKMKKKKSKKIYWVKRNQRTEIQW